MYTVNIYTPDQKDPAFTVAYDTLSEAEEMADVVRQVGLLRITVNDRVLMQYTVSNVTIS